MIITISGVTGAGKGTLAKMLAKKLGWPSYSIGNMRREMARERGMSLAEFNALGEKSGFTDKDVDEWQAKLGRTKDNIIVEGRTSFHFIPQSFKVFLDVDLREGARRIMEDPQKNRNLEKTATLDSMETSLRKRMASDRRRYAKYYRLNVFKRSNYDLIVDTTRRSPAQTCAEVLRNLPVNKTGTGKKKSTASTRKPQRKKSK